MQVYLPDDKLQQILQQVGAWLSQKKARDIVAGRSLKHATKVVAPGRTFLSRMYHAAARLKHLSYYTCLTAAFHSDLR